MLSIVGKYSLKEIQQIQINTSDFDDMLVSKRYAVFKGKIFYFYKDSPYPEGILEAEDLLDEHDLEHDKKSQHLQGPFKFKGSNRFYNVYRKNNF